MSSNFSFIIDSNKLSLLLNNKCKPRDKQEIKIVNSQRIRRTEFFRKYINKSLEGYFLSGSLFNYIKSNEHDYKHIFYDMNNINSIRFYIKNYIIRIVDSYDINNNIKKSIRRENNIIRMIDYYINISMYGLCKSQLYGENQIEHILEVPPKILLKCFMNCIFNNFLYGWQQMMSEL